MSETLESNYEEDQFLRVFQAQSFYAEILELLEASFPWNFGREHQLAPVVFKTLMKASDQLTVS